jgi:thiamine-phosphate pyrophosphorylase
VTIADASLYLVAPARLEAGALADLIPELVAAGVDIVQLREKELEAKDILRLAAPVLEACRAAGIPFLLNDRPDLAATLGADGVHVGQDDLPVEATRAVVGAALVGLSTHARAQIDAAIAAAPAVAPDYLAVGPVFDTPTKPGRPGVGFDLLRYASETVTIPWFAIGGIDRATLDDVMDAGATRVVVVRAITEAADPVAAAAALKEQLRG